LFFILEVVVDLDQYKFIQNNFNNIVFMA